SSAVGDVVTFSVATLGGRGASTTTHRVVSEKQIQGRTYFQTKGDANQTPDPDLVPGEAAYGKVSLTVPKAGYLMRYANSVPGRAVLLMIPLAILLGQEAAALRRLRRSSDNPKSAPD